MSLWGRRIVDPEGYVNVEMMAGALESALMLNGRHLSKSVILGMILNLVTSKGGAGSEHIKKINGAWCISSIGILGAFANWMTAFGIRSGIIKDQSESIFDALSLEINRRAAMIVFGVEEAVVRHLQSLNMSPVELKEHGVAEWVAEDVLCSAKASKKITPALKLVVNNEPPANY